MYSIITQQIPQSRRAEINEKILFSIDTGKEALDNETIYNCYTGIGGLHNLKASDYSSYYAYSDAKKEIEMGQFFTPHQVCRRMVTMIAPTESDTVLDMCCGMGNFINFVPNQYNAYGFDIDANAVRVAKHLYPNANIEQGDIRQYNPSQRFDMVIGNPPFNLDFDRTLSQFYYISKAHQVLNPAGLLMVIVPQSFLSSEFWERSRVTAINRDFSFIGQAKLAFDSFASVGVADYRTKIMVFMRESKHVEMKPFVEDDFVGFEELGERIAAAKELKRSLRMQIVRETSSETKEETERFEHTLKKYLYELKAHKHLHKHYDKAVALVSKFRNQQPPEGATNEQYKEWERKRLTHAQVLSIIKRYITRQNEVPRKEVALVRTSYGYKLKGYAHKLLDGVERTAVSMNDLIVNDGGLPAYDKMTPKLHAQYDSAMKTVERKRREYFLQSKEFSEMERNPALDEQMRKLTFINKEKRICWFTKLQQHDMGLLFQKRYSLLNWQQGSGKTAVVYHYGKYLLSRGLVKNAVVLAPAIATNLTWEVFLTLNKQQYYVVRSIRDFENIPEGVFVVVSLSMIGTLKRSLIRFMKLRSNKVCLLFDESDEITNPNSGRTVNSLSIFRRAKYKMLATGTTTRNNIGELYSQFEMLYNNSINMLCWCTRIYRQNREKEIESDTNDNYGLPFPARGGANLFKSCFCPSKASVFGIEKQNQDIYNKEHLAELIGKTIITRKFKEFAGEKYKVKTHTVQPSDGEREVYRTIMKEFMRICNLYFKSTGDAKKEAALRIIRQIQLLIKACSVPHTFDDYYGEEYPEKVRYIENLISTIPTKVAVGCTTLNAMGMYATYLSEKFPFRPMFIIQGDVSFKKREKIIKEFEATHNGILICTQQSLKSSANIPTCDDVILESLQWNIPKMEQFYFRFIRLDSKRNTNVHFVTYADSIEQNLIALVLTKERLNEFIKTGEVKEQSDIFDDFDVSQSLVENLLRREQDDNGNFYISWGAQKVS